MSTLNIKERCRRKLIKSSLRLSRADSGGFILVEAILNEIRHMTKQLETQTMKTRDKESNNLRVDYAWLKTTSTIPYHSSHLKPATLGYNETTTITNQQRLFSEIENLCLSLNSVECGQVLKAFRVVQNALDKSRPSNRASSIAYVDDGVDVSESRSNTDEKSQETLSIEIISSDSSSENLISFLDVEDPDDAPNNKSSFDFLSKASPTKISQENGPMTEETRQVSNIFSDGDQRTMKLFRRPLVEEEDCSEMLESLEKFLRGVHKIILNIIAQNRIENKTKNSFTKKLIRGTKSLSISAKLFASKSLEGKCRNEKMSEGKMTSSWSNLKIRPGSRATVVPSPNELH